jgi:glycosyltransferase involved in cell wall biosynthesis
MSVSIAATMIVQNEHEVIRRCLESLRSFDKVFILDTGSTDRTGEICREFPNVVYIADKYKWNDDDAEARNEALKLNHFGKFDWTYTIDADEWLEGKAADIIIEFANGAPASVLAADVTIRLVSDGSMHYQPRLFRNQLNIGYIGAGHPYLGFLDTRGAVPPSLTLDVMHMHEPSPNHRTDPERYMRQLNRAIAQDGRIPRHLFYLAREFAFRGRWQDAANLYREYLNDPRAVWMPEQNEARLNLAKCCWQMSLGEEARAMCLGAILRNPDYKAALLFMGEITWPEHRKIWERFAGVAEETNTLGKIGTQQDTNK